MKQVLNFVKLFLVILLVSLTSCTNDLSEKKSNLNFSFKLPQEKVSRTTGDNNESTLWNVTAVIENKKDIIQKIEQSAYSGETITISFNDIIVGQKVRINIDLTKNGETTPSYKGTSDWFLVNQEKNQIGIKLTKIVVDNTQNEEDIVPPIIILTDAASPEIILEPQDIVEIATPGSSETINKQLRVSAKSPDGGILTFKWQKEVSGEWEDINTNSSSTSNGITECTINVDISRGEIIKYRCIITNTNTKVNGQQTTTKDSRTATVAYVEGSLSSITAQYDDNGSYEIFESSLNYNNIKVTETYTSDSEPKSISFDASESRYIIKKVNSAEKAIGYVPYTVSCTSNETITTNLTVPVKYQLNANDFVITGSNQNNGNQEKIAQFTGNTVLSVGTSETSNIPNKIYVNENSTTAEDYGILEKLQSVWKRDNTVINNPTVDNSIKTSYHYTNTLTVPTENSWCVGDAITLEYYVQVCPWTIELQSTDGNNVDLENLTGGTTYTLSATNEADTSNVIWESNNTSFTISNKQLITPTANANNQTATITAKVVDTTIGTLNVTVPGIPLGTQGNPFTLWSDLKSYLETSSDTETEIYVTDIFEATSGITVNRPVIIKPVGQVNITRNVDSNLFYVNKNFTLEGTQENNIILDGNEKSYPLIYLSSNTPNISLKNCTLQDTNTNAMYVHNQNATINIENCTFKNNTTDIYIGNCSDILIINSTFDNDETENNIEVTNAPSLTLAGEVSIPKIYFKNNSISNTLGIKIGDNLTLKEENKPITISADNYIHTTYDCNFFDLTNGQTFPEGVFALDNEGYFLLNDGTITQLGLNASYPFTTWEQLKTYLENNLSDETEIYVTGNFDATSGITVKRPVTIIPVEDVTVTLDDNLSDTLFNVQADFTIRGRESANFIIDGDTNFTEGSLITTTNSDITLEYVTMQNYTNTKRLSSGGAITFNSAGNTLSLTNCTFENVITNYIPNNDYPKPIGAICFEDGNLILDSCTFTQDGDYATLYCYPYNTSNITLKGNIELPIIQYANIYGNLEISLDNTFRSNLIQVYVEIIYSQYDTDLFTLNGQTLPECFTLLNDGYEFNYTNGTIVEATAGGGGNPLRGYSVTDGTALKEAIENGTESVIIIAEDISLTEGISITREVTIAANKNVTITQPSGAKQIFTITADGNLTLGGGARTLTLKANSNATEELIYLKGTLLLTDNCTLTGVTNSYAENAICIVGGTFTMSGGEITENIAGSAINTNKTAQINNITMNIYGGKIYNNSGATNGGAINIVNASSYSTTVNIYGNVQIYNNTATSSGGSIFITGSNNNLYVNSHDTAENKAAIYDNNKSNTNQGASIYKNGGTFYLNKSSATGTLTPYSENINKP